MSWKIAALLLTALTLPRLSWAHHGWGWATDEEFEIAGRIVEVRLVKAERVVIEGVSYNLYPDRES